jgi:D-alanyl-D-alanine dipeptidase
MVAALLCLSGLAAVASATEMHAQPATMPPSFVYLRDVDPTILQDIRYAGENNFTGKPVPGYLASECILQRPAAEALKRVQARLKRQKLSLKVYDCYRPQRAVLSFVQWASTPDPAPATRRFFPTLAKDQLVPLGYIADKSSHPRGVAIDLTIVKLPVKAAAPFDPKATYAPCTADVAARAPDDSVDMGTGYDCFDTLSHTADPRVKGAPRKWRQVLLGAMTRERFENFEKEWWHYVFPLSDQTVYDFEVAPRGK